MYPYENAYVIKGEFKHGHVWQNTKKILCRCYVNSDIHMHAFIMWIEVTRHNVRGDLIVKMTIQISSYIIMSWHALLPSTDIRLKWYIITDWAHDVVATLNLRRVPSGLLDFFQITIFFVDHVGV